MAGIQETQYNEVFTGVTSKIHRSERGEEQVLRPRLALLKHGKHGLMHDTT